MLLGHTEEISTMALSNDVTMLVSGQCSNTNNKDEIQTKIIIWDVKTLKQKLILHQQVYALQCIAFSRDDRFLLTLGDYRRAQLTLWSTQDFTSLIHWEDDSPLFSYLNCLAWNPLRANEFSLGGSKGLVRFCTIIEQQTNDQNNRLQVVNGQIPSSLSENSKKPAEITACVYLISAANLLLCSTNIGFITCWNTRTNTCLLHWKADANEICLMTTIKSRLITGSSTGSLRLWNTESLETNLAQNKLNETSVNESFRLSCKKIVLVFF